MNVVAGEGKKSAKFGAAPPFGASTLWGPIVVQKFNIQKLAEVEIGRCRNWPKLKLAEVDRAQRAWELWDLTQSVNDHVFPPRVAFLDQ